MCRFASLWGCVSTDWGSNHLTTELTSSSAMIHFSQEKKFTGFRPNWGSTNTKPYHSINHSFLLFFPMAPRACDIFLARDWIHAADVTMLDPQPFNYCSKINLSSLLEWSQNDSSVWKYRWRKVKRTCSWPTTQHQTEIFYHLIWCSLPFLRLLLK